MIHSIFLLIKYQIRQLPTDPAELRELAKDLEVHDRLDAEPVLLQESIRQELKLFSDALYIALLLGIALLILFVWISNGMPL